MVSKIITKIILMVGVIFTLNIGLLVFKLPIKHFCVLLMMCTYWGVAGYMLAVNGMETEEEAQGDDE